MVLSPARLGADVVVHSISKFISGGSDVIAAIDDMCFQSFGENCPLPKKNRKYYELRIQNHKIKWVRNIVMHVPKVRIH
ncbi:uncharacterized protein LOC111308026 isoform X1 [Durio zibethinus]|uniref:Uncharacterized protein LOC111308026 isoform X1 n=1 Tax=Durio zibethinus TaxID=66656 RepID=A0A6P6AB43_DURZI|nr:uncharacterized protein LOC111308026 isoform X1 [Durio zibethinus]